MVLFEARSGRKHGRADQHAGQYRDWRHDLAAVWCFRFEYARSAHTYGDNKETGVTVGSGKNVATGGMMPGEKPTCTGSVQVTATLISGHYVCKGLSSHDSSTGKLGKVDVEVTFTAKS